MSAINPETGCPQDWHKIDTSSYSDGDWPRVSSNSDIGGIGGLVAFVASAYLTLLLVFLYYISGCRSNGTPPGLNRIDGHLIRKLSRWPGIRWVARDKESWEPFLRQAVLMYSDQQLIAGIAILASGYSQLTDLSSYHWQLMIYLAWFASLSHLTTLTALRDYFRENTSSKSLRLILMLLTMLLLIAALIPTGDKSWIESPQMDFTGSIRAICFYQRVGTGNINTVGNQGVYFVVSVFILIFGCAARTIRLYGASSTWCEVYLRKSPSAFLHSRLDSLVSRLQQSGSSFRWQSCYLVVCMCYLLPKAVYEIYGSMFWEIWWLFVGLLFGLLRLSLSRDSSGIIDFGQQHKPLDDDKWTFGQGIAIIFLALPVLTLFGNYHEIRLDARTTKQDRRDDDTSLDYQQQTQDTPSNQILILGRSPNIPNLAKPSTHSQTEDTLNHTHAIELQPVASSANHAFARPSLHSQQTDSKHSHGDIEERFLPFRTASLSPETPHLDPHTHLAALYKNPYRYEWFRLTIRMLILFSFYTLLNIVVSVNIGGEVGVGIFASVAVAVAVLMLCAAGWAFGCLWWEVYVVGSWVKGVGEDGRGGDSRVDVVGSAGKEMSRRHVYWRHKIWKIGYWILMAGAMAFATIMFYLFNGGLVTL